MGKVIIIEDPLNVTISGSGLATENKQDFEILALNAVLLELQLKADLTETQPVSVQNFPSFQDVVVTSIPEIEIKNDSGNPLSVSASSLPLPTGASSESTQILVKEKTDNLDVPLSTRLKPSDTLTKVSTVDTITNVVHIDDNGGSLTVDGTVTANTGLSQPLTDVQLRASAIPVSVSNFPSIQAVSQSGTWTSGRTWTLSGVTDSINATQGTSPWVTNDTGIPNSLGQSTMSGSTSVTIASDQSIIPVSLSDGTAPSIFRTLSLINVAQSVKSSSGDVWGFNIINDGLITSYVKFYNTSSGSVTVGTTTVVKTLAIPAKTTIFFNSDKQSIQSFSTAISVSCVTVLADNGTSSPGANIVYAEIFYK